MFGIINITLGDNSWTITMIQIFETFVFVLYPGKM